MIKIKLMIVSVVILSLFYLTVLYLSLKPNVSVAYSEYYIHNRTMFYSQNTPELLFPMDRLLTVTELTPYFSRGGWSKKSIKSGNALLISKASLLFNLKNKSKIKTFNFTFSASRNPVKLLFTVAGQQFEKRLVPGNAGLISLSVPNALLDDRFDVTNTLTINPSSPVSLISLMVKGS